MNCRTVLALVSQRHDLSAFKPMIEDADPGLDVVVWPDPRCHDAEIIAGWEVPPGLCARMPRLRLVHSIAAGVDNVIAGQALHAIPVCRVVDPLLAEGMLQYVLWAVLYFHRRFDEALRSGARHAWTRPVQTPAAQCRVGLMGLGEMASRVATILPSLGYTVNGWVRTPREFQGVNVFSGEAGLLPFLRATDVLVCLLPLTGATRGILSHTTLDALPRGAALVHCGRGEHLVERDLIEAIARGPLRGAVIDVFEQEPLHTDSPLWSTPGVLITPHMATMARPETVVAQVVENAARLRRGEALVRRVDLELGY
ncbi:2-hydroxyacid dehydrogenase [Variovorax sp. PBL-E5]|uniref:2-hydroxyacid dehydrogenase n=1 Tax=Variovorax sp. PBL-E5 TaxID=434014 RepID=UPI001315D3C4|nr:glyoxylate/hydroxypyruvate reductase A [Variovorax sp. PBL-E5]VTU22274.1 Glyoxylate/hydroxypyruvate reductase A [Variovorax sp. PBL-E5]